MQNIYININLEFYDFTERQSRIEKEESATSGYSDWKAGKGIIEFCDLQIMLEPAWSGKV